AVERRVDCECPGYRPTESDSAAVLALSHARTDHALATHRRRDGACDPEDVDVPAAFVSSEDSEAASATGGRRRADRRAASGRMAASGGIPGDDQPEQRTAVE